jgi:hypothetical protein
MQVVGNTISDSSKSRTCEITANFFAGICPIDQVNHAIGHRGPFGDALRAGCVWCVTARGSKRKQPPESKNGDGSDDEENDAVR